jgi:rubrerythrin
MATKNHWVCLACGYIDEGNEPPDECPICKAPKRAFYPRHEMPSAPPLKTVEEATVKPAPKEGLTHWVCLACGHIHEGDDPPDKCPICTAPKKAFVPRQDY